MTNKIRLIILGGAVLCLTAFFIFYDIGPNGDYVLPRRITKALAIIITASAIAFSTVVFQTITNNRILTPSILGLDSMYMLIQTAFIFILGSANIVTLNKNLNFIVSVAFMLVFAMLLFRIIFKRGGRNIYFLMLVGMIFGTLFSSATSFMQVLIDPNEFQIVQDKMFASFNNINSEILYTAIGLMLLTTLYFLRYAKYLDVMSLGREQAVNLGVDYDRVVKRLLMVVVILTSISTALVGPITFLGLLVANVAYHFVKTYRHIYIIPASMLLSILAVIGGQMIVERVFTFSTTLSVIINFIGGVYFIYLLLKENKSW